MHAENYIHGHHHSVVNAHATRTAEDSAAYLLEYLSPGAAVLDVGCGPGSITLDFAELVAPGSVTGVDRSEDVVAAAAAAAAARGAGNVAFSTGNVYDLDFPDGSFDVVHAHQVLQHLADPVAALREMRRVAKPGGVVAVREADFSGMSWFPPVPELAVWMDTYQRIARSNQAEPDAGRHLIAWALEAGFTDFAPSSSNWLYATQDRRRWLADSWADRVLQSTYAEEALARGIADQAQLERISEGWKRWAEQPESWFLMPSGELIARA